MHESLTQLDLCTTTVGYSRSLVFRVWSSKAPCVDIIDRARSTVEYDQRAEKQNQNLDPAVVSPWCPVLRDLLGSDPKKSEL